MKRQRVDMADLLAWENLSLAVYKAARGKQVRPDVAGFLADVDGNIANLRDRIQSGSFPLDQYHRFQIMDPKPRNITALGFEIRVLHHAIMNMIGENLIRSQIHSSFACMPGRGVHKAAIYVQRGLRRSGWYVKIDIEKYFERMPHGRLKQELYNRFKGKAFLGLLEAIIDSFSERPGQGLPIGALTSQYFANFFLETADRFIQGLPYVKSYCRYMDDMIWFTADKPAAKASLQDAVNFLSDQELKVKDTWQIQPSRHGVSYCGYRIQPFSILLSRRKKRNYRRRLRQWEDQWRNGNISDLELQQGYDAVHGMTAHTRSVGFRKSVIAAGPLLDV
jgi:hypothetical protein